MKAVSADTPQLATSVRARHDRQTLRFAADLAQRAVLAAEPITLSIAADVHSLGTLVSPGMLIAAPFRTSRTQGAILIYPRRNAVFTGEERALVGAIVGFGAVAIAHAELYATSHGQAHELHQLLEISSQLGSSKDLEHFLQGFVVRAAEFLRFGRCFIALFENNEFRVRYGVKDGEPSRSDVLFPEGIATKALRRGEVFWTDEASRTPGANLEVVAAYKVQQFLAVPLLGAGGKLLGMFGVLDRLEGGGISEEDVRRARALSNQAAIMLEAAGNLHASEQHRRQAEALVELGPPDRRDFASARLCPSLCVPHLRADGFAIGISRRTARRELAGRGFLPTEIAFLRVCSARRKRESRLRASHFPQHDRR